MCASRVAQYVASVDVGDVNVPCWVHCHAVRLVERAAANQRGQTVASEGQFVKYSVTEVGRIDVASRIRRHGHKAMAQPTGKQLRQGMADRIHLVDRASLRRIATEVQVACAIHHKVVVAAAGAGDHGDRGQLAPDQLVDGLRPRGAHIQVACAIHGGTARTGAGDGRQRGDVVGARRNLVHLGIAGLKHVQVAVAVRAQPARAAQARDAQGLRGGGKQAERSNAGAAEIRCAQHRAATGL